MHRTEMVVVSIDVYSSSGTHPIGWNEERTYLPSIRQRHDMIDIQITGISESLAIVVRNPGSADSGTRRVLLYVFAVARQNDFPGVAVTTELSTLAHIEYSIPILVQRETRGGRERTSPG